MVHPHNLPLGSDWKLVLVLEVMSLIELPSTPHSKTY